MKNGVLKSFLYKTNIIPFISKTLQLRKDKEKYGAFSESFYLKSNQTFPQTVTVLRKSSLKDFKLTGNTIEAKTYDLINNNNIRADIKANIVYHEMECKYKKIIENGVESPGSKKSNYVWICWFQGEENAPDLVKACINSIRQNLPDKEIIILSDKNISEYVHFPDYIVKKRQEGKISAAHYSDLIRVFLLCEYGGLWVDATVLCTELNACRFFEKQPLFIYQKMDLTRHDKDPIIASSWLIYSQSNQRILLLTKKLLCEYWKHTDELNNYFLFHIFFAISSRRYEEDLKAIPFYNNHSPHTLQFELADKFSEARWDEICGFSWFHKLNHHNDYQNYPESFYQKIIEIYYPK